VDDIDRAQSREQQDRDLALFVAGSQPALPDTGECHWCAASVPPGAHFCDVDCRSDFEREQAAAQRNGRPPQ
jgi:Uncharacterized protein containing a Zn-ribbon (DUF2116)